MQTPYPGLHYILHHYCNTYFAAHTSQNSFYKQTKISALEITIFGLKMKVKSGIDFFILKSNKPLQSGCCPLQKKSARNAELAWPVSSNSEGAHSISKKSIPLFTTIFKPKMVISRSEILVHLHCRFLVSDNTQKILTEI